MAFPTKHVSPHVTTCARMTTFTMVLYVILYHVDMLGHMQFSVYACA